MLRGYLLHLSLFIFLVHQSLSNPVSNERSQSDRSEQQSNTPEKRFDVSSAMAFGVNPSLGFAPAANPGNGAYPNYPPNVGTGNGGRFGNSRVPNGGSAGGYSPSYNGGTNTGYNGGSNTGYASGYNGAPLHRYPTRYNGDSSANYPSAFGMNGGMGSYPSSDMSDYAPPTYDYGYGNYGNGYGRRPPYGEFGNNFGGGSPYGGGGFGGDGYVSGFECGSHCGENMRRCSTACSQDFWTYLCVVCVGPKWDNCRRCFD